MPATSKSQLKFIYAMRDKYNSKSDTPEKMKWVWDEDWTDVKMSDLPDKAEEECQKESYRPYKRFFMKE